MSGKDETADSSGVELSETTSSDAASDQDTHLEHCKFLCIPCPCKHSVKNQHEEYTPYHERRCTNLICLVCYLFFLVAWGVIFGFAWKYGKPDVLTHSMDSHGNICGVEGSNVVEVDEKTVTNSFADGSMPEDLVKAKYGMFPRIASDIAAQISKLKKNGGQPFIPSFTQLCVDECPPVGSVVCNYKFLYKWGAGDRARLSSKSANPVTDPQVKRFMRFTGDISRELSFGQSYRVESACSGAGEQELQKMCAEAFVACDIVPANSKPILGRCVPYIDIGPKFTIERCTEPLTNVECDPEDPAREGWNVTGSDIDFNTQCITTNEKDANGTLISRVPKYTPVRVDNGDGSFKLSGASLDSCITMERKGEQTQVIIPQFSYLSYLTSAASSVAQYMGDVQTAWYVVLAAGLACPLVVSFFYTCIMQRFATQMVWCAIFLFMIANLVVAFMCLVKGGAVPVAPLVALLDSSSGGDNATETAYSIRVSEDYAEYYLAAGFILLIAFIVVVCMVLFARKAIQTAVYIVEMSAKAIAHMKSLVFFPIITFFGVAATGAVFIVQGVLLLTAGSVAHSQLLNDTLASAQNSSSDFDNMLAESFNPATLKNVPVLNYLMIFDLFMFLWTTEFIQAVGIMTVGGAVSHWYFAPGKSDGGNEDVLGEKEVDAASHGHSHPCCCAFWTSLRFHMGSAAFGACIIATMNMIRIAFEYVHHKIEVASPDLKNKCWFKMITFMLKCCLACLEKCIRFLSKQSYIYTAIKGNGFCFSAVRSYTLMFNNLLRFGATNSITAILMILGKAMVCLFSMMFGYAWVNYSSTFNDRTKDTYVTSSLFISICILMLAYLVAEAFFNIFHVAIDTSLLCYCLDLADTTSNKSKRSATMKKSMAGIGKKEGKADHDALEEPSWVKNSCCSRCC
jgi:hypothetical protein